MRILFILAILLQGIFLMAGVNYKTQPPLIDNKLEKTTLTPCVQTLLNEAPLSAGKPLSIKAKGTITVEGLRDEKIFFNLTLKTNPARKTDPPIYLRFVKINQLDIRKVLDYARVGDEIYIEQYVNKQGVMRCSPSSFVVT
jgi:hypothetical protein